MSENNKKNIIPFNGSLYTDVSPLHQPQGTQRFALNMVNDHSVAGNEVQAGYSITKTNEKGNTYIKGLVLKEGYTPIGDVYIGDNSFLIFSTDGKDSEIGLMADDTYTVILNHRDLDFKLTHPIKAIYRVRRGCDKTVYWTDGLHPVRFYVLNKEEDFKRGDTFAIEKTHLFKRFKKIPTFENMYVQETGNLKAGSYNFAIQYLDEDLNPTEWITTSRVVNIYHDKLSKPYAKIGGSTNKETFYQQFGITSKSIEVEIGNLDDSFPFYRIAILEATTGMGVVNKVSLSHTLSTKQTTYLVTGDEQGTTTKEEILQEMYLIDTAEHILQVENTLVLAHTTGKQTDYCALQQYASKITSHCTIEPIQLFDIHDPTNAKNPVREKRGYMPGEVYSFGIVYVFEDGTTSPAYHIPGGDTGVYPRIGDEERRANRYPMAGDNTTSTTYTDSSNCEDTDYWGADAKGVPLKDKRVRHHRFPTRRELGLDFLSGKEEYKKDEVYTQIDYYLDATKGGKPTIMHRLDTINNKEVEVTFKKGFSVAIYIKNIKTNSDGNTVLEVEDYVPNSLKVKNSLSRLEWHHPTLGRQSTDWNYERVTISGFETNTRGGKNGIILSEKIEIGETDGGKIKAFFITEEILHKTTYKITKEDLRQLLRAMVRGEHFKNSIPLASCEFLDSGIDIPLTVHIDRIEYNTVPVKKPHIESTMLGIQFSNIELPKGVKGYYIVRNERAERDKTQLDTGLLLPMRQHKHFIGISNIAPTGKNLKLRNDFVALYHLEHNFYKKEYNEEYKYQIEGYYEVGEAIVESDIVQDVQTGTTYDSSVHKKDEKDEDGFSLHVVTKYIDSGNYVVEKEEKLLTGIEEVFYLQPLNSKNKEVEGENKEIYNLSGDNPIGVIQFKNVHRTSLFEFESRVEHINIHHRDVGDRNRSTYLSLKRIPIVSIKRNNKSFYANFRELPYYKEHPNMEVGDTVKVFNGDSYLSPFTLNTTMHYNTYIPPRETKSSLWKYIAGGVLLIAGIIGGILTGGTLGVVAGIGIGMLATAGAVYTLASGLELDKLTELYRDKYNKGLREVLTDSTLRHHFTDYNDTYKDDTVQWYNIILSNLYFETSVNTALRQGNNKGLPNPIEVPTLYNKKGFNSRAVQKVSVFDPKRKGGRLYQGFATPEFFDINKDFDRPNKEKTYFHLGLEYDCCSDCREVFPHRVAYSQQSFNEELTDNYRVFLPNNYRDIGGETGEITHLFTMRDHLFVHTQEALWNLPKNVERREVSEVVSYIGTGTFFSNPPVKMRDAENGLSAGLQHRWSVLQCEYGYFFVCENQGKILLFNGQSIRAISDKGMSKWFEKNIPIQNRGIEDNPFIEGGSGYITTLDDNGERLLVTKVDKGGWTLSFDLNLMNWTSYHSYRPHRYLYSASAFYSWKRGSDYLWKHGEGLYGHYYGKVKEPFIIEYVSLPSPIQTMVFDALEFVCKAEKYDEETETYVEVDDTFFTTLVAYNSKQCTGELTIKVKNKEGEDYLMTQVAHPQMDEVTVQKKEQMWYLNTLRDIRVAYDKPIFVKPKLNVETYIDKELNVSSMDFDKSWDELEVLRDKYLVIRLIFDNLDETKLSLDFSLGNEKISVR